MNLSTDITGLNPGTPYRWVFCASPNSGGAYACTGPRGKFGSTTADPPPDYATFTTAAGWSIQTTPNPTGALGSALSGVSCSSATACTTVGNYIDSADTQATLAERWDGTTWSIQTTPNPTGAHASVLSDVSCTSATACTAVGNYINGSSTQATLAERWDGTTWSIQTTPNPTGAHQSVLSGVSCTSATACTATGYYDTNGVTRATLAERWDGTAWTIDTTPTGAQDSFLSGVSCTSATACTAVGSYTNSSFSQLTLAERWDGASWTIQPTPSPTGAQSVTLSGVSCTSATACTAVGDFGSVIATIGVLAERWDGIAWTGQNIPDASGANQSFLPGVACTSATACTAAGYGQNTNARTSLTLAEHWDGTAWTIQTIPSPTLESFLFGLSCTSGTACTAVGAYPNGAGTDLTLAERYSG